MNNKYECYFCGEYCKEEELEKHCKSEDVHVCKNEECISQIKGNTSGYCSTYCQITGKCDYSC
jgi:hypothetical protein